MKIIWYSLIVLNSSVCKSPDKSGSINRDINIATVNVDTIKPFPANDSQQIIDKSKIISGYRPQIMSTVTALELVAFAKSLIGIPYKYASSEPSIGFDCSGFITYVFNHFNIEVPRSSVDFTDVGKEINFKNAKEGDLILFTGTIDSIRIVGHMGIVAENADTLKFIHSTSGRANGVTISKFTDHYKRRFVKIIRFFPD